VSERVGEPRLLSSRQTFWLKFVFPPLWVGGFGAGTLAFWMDRMSPAPPSAVKWVFLGAWLGGSALIWWTCCRLKRVRVDEAYLHVSNFRTEVRIPLAALARISESRWVNPNVVTLEFRNPTPFGQRIAFIPKARWVGWFDSHPVVAELRELSARAGGQAAS
jgi:hypothetical protein